MSIPYMPLYIEKYEADTGHLSMEEDGIYNRLLRLCWRTPGCSVPDDDVWLARQLRVTPEYFAEKVRPIIAEFFKRRKARLYSPRQQQVLGVVLSTSKARSIAGAKGGRPRKSLETKEPAESPAIANGKHINLNSNLKEKEKKKEKSSDSQKAPAAPAYTYDGRLSFGENDSREKIIEWLRSKTRPKGLGATSSSFVRAMVRDKLITAEDERWLLAAGICNEGKPA